MAVVVARTRSLDRTPSNKTEVKIYRNEQIECIKAWFLGGEPAYTLGCKPRTPAVRVKCLSSMLYRRCLFVCVCVFVCVHCG